MSFFRRKHAEEVNAQAPAERLLDDLAGSAASLGRARDSLARTESMLAGMAELERARASGAVEEPVLTSEQEADVDRELDRIIDALGVPFEEWARTEAREGRAS
jgi:hypothetical protein